MITQQQVYDYLQDKGLLQKLKGRFNPKNETYIAEDGLEYSVNMVDIPSLNGTEREPVVGEVLISGFNERTIRIAADRHLRTVAHTFVHETTHVDYEECNPQKLERRNWYVAKWASLGVGALLVGTGIMVAADGVYDLAGYGLTSVLVGACMLKANQGNKKIQEEAESNAVKITWEVIYGKKK